MISSFSSNGQTQEFYCTDSKLGTTLCSIITQYHRKERKALLSSFHYLVTLWNFIHRLKSYPRLVQRNKQHHGRVLLTTFHLNGHSLGFPPQTEMLDPRYRTQDLPPKVSIRKEDDVSRGASVLGSPFVVSGSVHIL